MNEKKGGIKSEWKTKIICYESGKFYSSTPKICFFKKKCHKWSDQCDAAPYIIAKSIEK